MRNGRFHISFTFLYLYYFTERVWGNFYKLFTPIPQMVGLDVKP
jgi:hypothetical protein